MSDEKVKRTPSPTTLRIRAITRVERLKDKLAALDATSARQLAARAKLREEISAELAQAESQLTPSTVEKE